MKIFYQIPSEVIIAHKLYPKNLENWQGGKGRASGVYVDIHEECEIPPSTQPVSSKSMDIRKEYDTDFYAWTLHNAALLKERKLSEIDIENIAEEIESIGKNTRRLLENQLSVLMAHLLRWQIQLEKRKNSWKYTIQILRDEVLELLEESPSLKNTLQETLSDSYLSAVRLAASDMDLTISDFPKECPFSLAEILNAEFFPN